MKKRPILVRNHHHFRVLEELWFLPSADWLENSASLLFLLLIGQCWESDVASGPMRGCHTLVRSGPAGCADPPRFSFLSLSLSFSAPALPEDRAAFDGHAVRTSRHRTAANPRIVFAPLKWTAAWEMLRLIFLAALAALSRASDVLDYTDDDFESRIGDHDLILVEFFAPWWVLPSCVPVRSLGVLANAGNAAFSFTFTRVLSAEMN